MRAFRAFVSFPRVDSSAGLNVRSRPAARVVHVSGFPLVGVSRTWLPRRMKVTWNC